MVITAVKTCLSLWLQSQIRRLKVASFLVGKPSWGTLGAFRVSGQADDLDSGD